MKKTALALLVLACASCALAENVLRIMDTDTSATGTVSDWYCTKNYAFADKVSTSVTVAIWAKDMNGQYKKFIAGVPDRWELCIPHTADSYNRKLAFRTQYGYAQADKYILDDGKWHFVVGTFNYDVADTSNNRQCLYVDGALVASMADSDTLITGGFGTPTCAFSLGAQASGMNNYANWRQDINGYFAELSVWNRALTAAEVSALFQKTTRLCGNETGLVAYWPLTGKVGMPSADYSFANVAATTGVAALSLYAGTGRLADADDFTMPFIRCIASPEWCVANGYVQAADATGRSWADPLTNLVAAAAAAVSHERILCSPGTHRIETSMSLLVDHFYLGSCNPATGEPCSAEVAIIDAQEKCRHLFSSTAIGEKEMEYTVENLTFVNGRESSGGSMSIAAQWDKPRIGRINNCIFHDNIATNGHGGAINSYLVSGAVVSNCLFYGNGAAGGKNQGFGGAVYTQQNGDSVSDTDFCRFVDCVFTNNTADSGGGVYASRCAKMANCLFADNIATNSEGGHLEAGSNSYIDGCLFTGRCKARYGSCMNIRGNGTVFTNCVFRNLTGEGATYGLIHFSSSFATFVDCVITNNVNNDAIFFPEVQTNILFRQCLIANNASDKVVIRDWKSSSRFENCTILQSKFDSKDQVWCTNVVVNCILPNATVSSKNDYCNILSNCCVAAEQGGPFDSNVYTFDPRFTDAEHGDYTLKRYSPCREKGVRLDWMTAESLDFAGLPRVVDAFGIPFSAAALPDLGCYEIQDFVRGTILSFK